MSLVCDCQEKQATAKESHRRDGGVDEGWSCGGGVDSTQEVRSSKKGERREGVQIVESFSVVARVCAAVAKKERPDIRVSPVASPRGPATARILKLSMGAVCDSVRNRYPSGVWYYLHKPAPMRRAMKVATVMVMEMRGRLHEMQKKRVQEIDADLLKLCYEGTPLILHCCLVKVAHRLFCGGKALSKATCFPNAI